MRKKSLTMIEVLVSFTLFAILFSALMGSLYMMSFNHQELDQSDLRLAQIRNVQYTLSKYLRTLPSKESAHITLEPKDGQPLLSFISTLHTDRDADFFGSRRITLSKEGNALTFKEQSLTSPAKSRTTTLISEISSLDIQAALITEPKEIALIRDHNVVKEGDTPFAITCKIGIDDANYSIAWLIPPDFFRCFNYDTQPEEGVR